MMTTRSLLLLFGTLLFAVNTYAQQPSTTPLHPVGAQSISGEVLKIEGETYVIRDAFGKEVHLRVDQNSPDTRRFVNRLITWLATGQASD